MSGEIHLLKGRDPILLGEATTELVDRLVGDAERDEVLSEFRGDDYDINAAVLAVATVSMFGDRVVVARDVERFTAAELTPLVEYLADPVPDASLVLVAQSGGAGGSGGGTGDGDGGTRRSGALPKKLLDAVKAAGGTVVDTGAPSGKGQAMWIDDHLDASSVRLSRAARQVLVERLGEDVSRLGGVLSVLEATFGSEGPLEPDEIEPFLGDAGGVPPWELTDAIDGGRTAEAVDKLRRMLHGGGRHPLQVMATLQAHYVRMLRLDGSDVRDEREAAALLGMKGSTFPAKKALAQAGRMGSGRIARAVQLLASADVDLRGRTAVPGEQTLEVLVARLAVLSSRRR